MRKCDFFTFRGIKPKKITFSHKTYICLVYFLAKNLKLTLPNFFIFFPFIKCFRPKPKQIYIEETLDDEVGPSPKKLKAQTSVEAVTLEDEEDQKIKRVCLFFSFNSVFRRSHSIVSKQRSTSNGAQKSTFARLNAQSLRHISQSEVGVTLFYNLF